MKVETNSIVSILRYDHNKENQYMLRSEKKNMLKTMIKMKNMLKTIFVPLIALP